MSTYKDSLGRDVEYRGPYSDSYYYNYPKKQKTSEQWIKDEG